MINELLAVPTDTGIGEVIHIAVLDGRIDDVIIFIKDQVKLGHRAAIEKAVGVELVGKIVGVWSAQVSVQKEKEIKQEPKVYTQDEIDQIEREYQAFLKTPLAKKLGK